MTAAGYLARRGRLLGDNAAAVLGEFVFHLAIPAALFLTLSRTPLSQLDGRPLIAFAVSTAVVLGAGWYGAGRWFGRDPGERAIWGMAGGYVNSANLGIPIALQVLGNISFLVGVVLLQTLIVTPVILIALDRHNDAAGRIRFRRIAALPVRNPVIMASALGVVASATDFRVPLVVHTPLTLLSAAAVPTALIALGASLHRQRPATPAAAATAAAATAPELIAPAASAAVPAAAGPAVAALDLSAGPADDVAGAARAAAAPAVVALAVTPSAVGAGAAADAVWRGGPGWQEVAAITALKLLAQPLIAYLVGAFALHLSHAGLLAVVVCAGLPTAQNTFIFAQHYRVGEAIASRAVLVTTTLSMASLAAAVALLGR